MILFAHTERTADAVIRVSAVQAADATAEPFAGMDFTIRQDNTIPPGLSRSTPQANRYGVSQAMCMRALKEMSATVRTIVMHGFDAGLWLREGVRVIDTAELSKPMLKLGDESYGYRSPTLYEAAYYFGDANNNHKTLYGAEAVRLIYRRLCEAKLCEAA
jgi:hypothetical protein